MTILDSAPAAWVSSAAQIAEESMPAGVARLCRKDFFAKGFNGKLRDKYLHETLFGTSRDARKTLEEWQEDCNWCRPQSVLANLTPLEFLHRKAMNKMAA